MSICSLFVPFRYLLCALPALSGFTPTPDASICIGHAVTTGAQRPSARVSAMRDQIKAIFAAQTSKLTPVLTFTCIIRSCLELPQPLPALLHSSRHWIRNPDNVRVPSVLFITASCNMPAVCGICRATGRMKAHSET